MLEPGVAWGRNEGVLQRSAEQKHRRSWGWLLAGISLSLGVLTALPFGYWYCVNAVPVLPRPPAPPIERNGLVQALAALNAIPATAYHHSEAAAPRAASVAPMLAQTRAALKQEWSVWRPVGDPLDTGHMPTLARFLVLESRARREHGDLSGALSSALDAFELGLRLTEAGGMAARFSGWSCAEMGLVEVETLCPELPAAVLEKHLPRVRQLRTAWPQLAEIAARERHVMVYGCRSYLQKVSRMSLWKQLDDIDVARSRSSGGQSEVRLYRWETWKEALVPHSSALAEVDRYCREMEAVVRQNPSEAGVHAVMRPENRWAEDFCYPPPVVGRGREWPELSLALLETAMAVRLETLTNGRPPHTLADIARSRLPEVPQDIWGQPVHYRVREGRPTVYSLGPGGTDERGKALPRTSIRGTAPGDLVFGRLSDRAWRKR